MQLLIVAPLPRTQIAPPFRRGVLNENAVSYRWVVKATGAYRSCNRASVTTEYAITHGELTISIAEPAMIGKPPP